MPRIISVKCRLKNNVHSHLLRAGVGWAACGGTASATWGVAMASRQAAQWELHTRRSDKTNATTDTHTHTQAGSNNLRHCVYRSRQSNAADWDRESENRCGTCASGKYRLTRGQTGAEEEKIDHGGFVGTDCFIPRIPSEYFHPYQSFRLYGVQFARRCLTWKCDDKSNRLIYLCKAHFSFLKPQKKDFEKEMHLLQVEEVSSMDPFHLAAVGRSRGPPTILKRYHY